MCSVLLAVSLVSALIVGTHTACRAADTIKIGVIYRLTGGAAAEGREVRAGAVIHDPEQVKERVLKLVKTGKMTSIDGFGIALEMDSLCVHGDNPEAWQLARTIREALESSGIRVVPMGIK